MRAASALDYARAVARRFARGARSCGHKAPARRLEIPIVVEQAGASPETIETAIAGPIEHGLMTWPRAVHVRTKIEVGVATITVELEPDVDGVGARSELVTRLEAVQPQLPPGVLAILGATIDRDAEPVRYVLRSTQLNTVALRTWQDLEARPSLLPIPGVAGVDSCGGELEQLAVELAAEELEQILRIDGRRWVGVRARGDEAVIRAALAALVIPAGAWDRTLSRGRALRGRPRRDRSSVRSRGAR